MKRLITITITMLLAMMLAFPSYAEELPSPVSEEAPMELIAQKSMEEQSPLSTDEPLHVHQFSDWIVVSQPTCTSEGIEERYCTAFDCPDLEGSRETRQIAPLGHDWGGWTSAIPATIFSGGLNTQYCSRCGVQNQMATAPETPFVAWAYKASKVPRKSKVAFSVSLANGDYVTKWKSSKKKIASVSSSGVVKGKKNGKTKITAYTASGLKISCTVKVVKPSKKKKKSSSSGGTVYWTPSGKVYHRSASCPTLSRSKTVYSGTVNESGKSRCCKVCG